MVDAIYLFKQRIEPEPGVTGIVRSLCHEFSHILGKLIVTTVEGSAKDYDYWILPDEYLIGNVKCFQSLMGKLESYKVEKIHPSSYIKEWLGWLTYTPAKVNSTLTITALDKLSLGGPVYTIDYQEPGSLHSYYILEYRNALKSSLWDKEFSYDATSVIKKEVIIYNVKLPENNPATLNWVWAMFEWNGVLNVTSNTFKDPVRRIEIKPVKLEDDTATLQYSSFKPVNLVGAVANPVATPPLLNMLGDERTFTLPDIDLHAYTSDGRHVGVNYVTGIYENQIKGTLSSGDLIGGEEWIFVPSNINVAFHVSSKDTAAYLKELPEANTVTNGDTTYSIQVIKYDSAGAKTSSRASMQTVKAGSALEHSYTVSGSAITVSSKQSTVKEILAAETQPSSIKITVRDSNGNPISGASISSISQPAGQSTLNGVSVADGTATFSNVMPGSYTIQASKSSYESGTAQGSVVAGSILQVTVSLQPPSSGSGGIPGYQIESIMIGILLASLLIILIKGSRAQHIGYSDFL